MSEPAKTNLFQQLLARKLNGGKSPNGTLANADLSRKFIAGEKPQPKIRRGGRNGSGKP